METSQSSKTISLSDYWDMLDKHDWYYEFSDDNRVWQAGRQSETSILELSKTSQEYSNLANAFYGHMFSGKAYGNEQQPKPARP